MQAVLANKILTKQVPLHCLYIDRDILPRAQMHSHVCCDNTFKDM